jgi:putative FmdB family regulatory protein
MPTYDYVCRACGHRIEVHHGLYADGPTQCPNCHSHALRKAIAAPAVVFKGSGWAKKDRGRSSRSKAAAADTAGGEGGNASGSDGGDSPKRDSPNVESPKGATGGAEPAASPTASATSGGSGGSTPAPGAD